MQQKRKKKNRFKVKYYGKSRKTGKRQLFVWSVPSLAYGLKKARKEGAKAAWISEYNNYGVEISNIKII